MLIQVGDIETLEQPDPSKSVDALNDMIGSKELKNSLISYINYIYFIRERQKHGYADVIPPLHMLFTGNRGTGKTWPECLGRYSSRLGFWKVLW